jgi:hypothetical protein
MTAQLRFAAAALVLAGVAISLAWGQAATKPVTEQDIATMVGLGLDDDAIVARIKKSGLAFDVSDAALAKLKSSGASENVVKAVQDAAKAPPAAAPQNAVTYDQVLQMLTLGIDEESIFKRLARSPTVFTLDARQTEALKKAGATDKLLAAMSGQRAAPAQGGDVTDLAIILDCSGSMRELTTGGETKMEVAKRVVNDLVQKIPLGLNVTFVLYGHEVYGGADDPRNCQAVKIARPLSPLDAVGKSDLAHMISGLKPTGATPIALSLRTAGQELAKNNALCGLILITDGVETCKGDPAGEAAALVRDLKVSFGVNVVGFGVKPEENAALQSIATAGRGKYYAAANARELTDAIAAIAQEIQTKAKPPEAVTATRRAVKVLQPAVEMPAMAEIVLVETDGPIKEARLYKKASITKYDEEIRIPSPTTKYDLVWYPKEGEGILMVKGISLPERKVMNVKPEDYLGFIKVNGKGTTKGIHVNAVGNPMLSIYSTQRATKFGQVMVVPKGSYDVYVDNNLIEEGLKVEPGKLYELE